MEQLDEVGDEPRVRTEHVLDVRLAEGEADLTQVLAVGADHRHLTGAQTRLEDEAVVPVGLDVAGDEGSEGVLQRAAAGFVQLHSASDAHADVVEEHPLVVDAERVGALVERLQPEVVEQREQRRERRRLALAIDAESPLPRRCVDVVTERRGQLAVAGEERGDAAHVADCPVGRHGRAVGGWGVLPHPVEQGTPAVLTDLRGEGRSEPVGPRRRQVVDRALEGLEIRLALPLGCAHAHGDAGERAGADVRLEHPPFRCIGGGHRVGDPLGQLGGEPRAREVDEHRRPRTDGFGDFEDADELTLLEADDRRDQSRQSRRLELEHEVARQVLQDGARGPPGVGVDSAGCQVEGVGDRRTDAGDVEDADPVGVRRQEADEARLAPAGLIGDGDHRLPVAAEHARGVVGAGDGDGAVVAHRTRSAHSIVDPREAELAAGAKGQLAVVTDVELGAAEEHERTGGEPRQERIGVAELGHAATHGIEVDDDPADVLEGGEDLGLQLGGRGGVRAVDLELRPRLERAVTRADGVRRDVGEPMVVVAADLQHRVDEEVHADAAPLEDHAHRVDEEGHVIGDREEHGVR